MRKYKGKCLLLLALILLLSAVNGKEAEAAVWKKANYTVQTTARTGIYKKATAGSSNYIASLKKGKKIKVLQVSKYGWGKIKYKGKVRYIQMYRTKIPWSNLKKNMQTAKKVVVYSKTKATSKYKLMTVAVNRVVYAVKKSGDGWTKITYKKKTGYVRTSALKAMASTTETSSGSTSSGSTSSDSATASNSMEENAASYQFTVSSTVHSTIIVKDASGNRITSGSYVKPGTKLTATISLSSGYQFKGYTGATTSTARTATFTMPAKKSGICAKVTCANAGKQTYACMSDPDKLKVIYAVVRWEGGATYEGQVAVMTTVMNRLESSMWKGRGADPYAQLTAYKQFADVSDPAVLAKWSAQVNSNTIQAVTDVMNGLRTHDCCSFRTSLATYKALYPYGYDIQGNWFFN
jgi:uncharacterized protein YgiM (DUF1202 family)